jgi:hypothetical protein
VRLRQVEEEYNGRVVVRKREFPLELLGREVAPRELLAEEWWLAAVQEAAAEFSASEGDDWPTTTLPAFVAVRAVAEQDERIRIVGVRRQTCLGDGCRDATRALFEQALAK